MGSLIKQWVGPNRSVYHITVMPCYDKKLEAAREDFTDKQTGDRDVDCVITASECSLVFSLGSFAFKLTFQLNLSKCCQNQIFHWNPWTIRCFQGPGCLAKTSLLNLLYTDMQVLDLAGIPTI